MKLEDLLRECQKGNAMAWEMFVREYQGRVFRISFMYTRNRDHARDLTQDIFIRIYRKMHTWHESESAIGWIVSIARNMGIDYLRAQKSRPPTHDIPIEEREDLIEKGVAPDTALAVRTRRQLIQRALDSLSDISREMILLKEMQELTFDEIAEMLGIPAGTAKSRSNRARLELATALQALGGWEVLS
jgi:RNA polymerase sigma-70 factor, ECF subfamily